MDFVEQVKSSVDIVRVVGEHVRLKKMGGSPRWMGLCPFHQEKTPSFSVHASLQIYKCFGCGAGGDVLAFVKEIEGVTFFEALKSLAERHGIPLPKRSDYSDPETKLRAALLEMHEIAAELFQSNLRGPQGAEARAYLNRRGVGGARAMEFGIGVSDEGWDQLARRLAEKKFAPELLEASGLVSKRQNSAGFYDRFRARLMFPIHDESGRIIGFGGRALKPEDEPKYLNSPETPVYKKSSVLYNLHRAKTAARKLDRIVLVEGYMDVIGVYSAGVQEVVASCGTALTNQQVRCLRRHSERVVVNYDPDTAGANASEKSVAMLLDEGLHVSVLHLEDGLDPDEFVKKHGAETYRQKLDGAAGYFHWLADRARRKHDMRTAEGRMAGLKMLLPAIQRVSDRLERAAVAEEVAGYLGIERGVVLDYFRRSVNDRQSRPGPLPVTPALPPVERLLLGAILISEQARSEALPRLREMKVVERMAGRTFFEALFAMNAEGGSFRFSDFEARLNEKDRTLLSTLVFADEWGEESTATKQAHSCLDSLQTSQRGADATDLRNRIRTAEREGNLEEALRLAHALNGVAVKRNR